MVIRLGAAVTDEESSWTPGQNRVRMRFTNRPKRRKRSRPLVPGPHPDATVLADKAGPPPPRVRGSAAALYRPSPASYSVRRSSKSRPASAAIRTAPLP